MVHAAAGVLRDDQDWGNDGNDTDGELEAGDPPGRSDGTSAAAGARPVILIGC